MGVNVYRITKHAKDRFERRFPMFAGQCPNLIIRELCKAGKEAFRKKKGIGNTHAIVNGEFVAVFKKVGEIYHIITIIRDIDGEWKCKK